jgi:GT2 family glycosyltransferase
MITAIAMIAFWGAAALLAWSFVGFPLVLAARAALAAAPSPRRFAEAGDGDDDEWPRVSYVIVVHNERAVILDKLENTAQLRYPRAKLEVIVASDGSDDGTDELVKQWSGSVPIRLLSLPRLGKNGALNAAVAEASGDVLAFSDADSMLEAGALERLVAPFADPSVDGVGGDYHYGAAADEGRGERTYWSIDRIWKRLESRSGSMTSATGQIYAIRAEVFEPVPDGVTDDFFVSTGAVARGGRLFFAEDAVARGPVADTADAEFSRKVRLMTRGIGSVMARRALLDPRRTGFYAVQLLTHKLLRRLCGLPVLVALLATPWLFDVHGFYRLALGAQVVVHVAAAVGWLARDRALGRSRVLSIPLFFDLVNVAGVLALTGHLRGQRHLGWVPYRSERKPASTTGGTG